MQVIRLNKFKAIKKLLLITLLLCFTLTLGIGCASMQSQNKLTQESLLHSNYVLESFNGEPFASSFRDPYIQFNEGFRVTGIICNNYMGQGTLENDILQVKQMATTLMICPDPKLNTMENIFGKMLGIGAKISVKGDKLILRDKSNEFVFKKQDLVN